MKDQNEGGAVKIPYLPPLKVSHGEFAAIRKRFWLCRKTTRGSWLRLHLVGCYWGAPEHCRHVEGRGQWCQVEVPRLVRLAQVASAWQENPTLTRVPCLRSKFLIRCSISICLSLFPLPVATPIVRVVFAFMV